MDRLRSRRVKLFSLIAVLALLPLTPLVASVIYRLGHEPFFPEDSPVAIILNWENLTWTVLLVAIAVALVPAGLILIRKPDASAPWTMALIVMALGVTAAAYSAAGPLIRLPYVSPLQFRMFMALSLVPAAAAILLTSKRWESGVPPLGVLAIVLGVVQMVYHLPRIPFLWEAHAFWPERVELFVSAIPLSIAPLIIGVALIQSNETSVVRALGILVIMLGIMGLAYRADEIVDSFVVVDPANPGRWHFDLGQWYGSTVVEIATVAAAAGGSTIAGTLMVRRREMSNTSALGLLATLIGIIGAAYSVSIIISTLLFHSTIILNDDLSLSVVSVAQSIPSNLSSAGLTALTFLAPLIVALSVVPVGAGVVLMRRPHASGAWALGLVTIVVGVVGTTYCALQILDLSPSSSLTKDFGHILMLTDWLP